MPLYRFLLPLIALGLLLAPPAFGFFEVLDELQQELSGEEESVTVPLNLDDLITELEKSTVSFTDVPSSAWYHDAVMDMASRGIISGYNDASGNSTGEFGPANPVTIAEILKMAYEAANRDTATCKRTVTLSQAASHWARAYVACAEEDSTRVLRTQPDLNRGALRAEVIAIIHDAFHTRVPAGKSPFTDTANHPYESDIALAAANGVIAGDTDAYGRPRGTFRPNDGVNRAEAAKIISEFLSRREESLSDPPR